MGYDDLIRDGIALARSLTLDLQPSLNWLRWQSQDSFGTPTYAATVAVRAIVERVNRLIKLSDGREVMITSRIYILEPLTALAASGRRNPIDERDIFVLPDGTSGPIVDIDGLIDAGTNAPYYHQVYLGD